MKKVSIVTVYVLFFAIAVFAQPQMPHYAYGNVTDSGEVVNDTEVAFYHSDSSVVLANTNSSGEYEVDIPYSSSYDGDDLTLYVNGTETNDTIRFESGGITELNHEGDYLSDNESNPDHRVYGKVTDDSSNVTDADVEFLYDGEVKAEDVTDSGGEYNINISYSSEYEDEELNLEIDQDATQESVLFDSGSVTQLDVEGDFIADESDSSDTSNSNSGGDSDEQEETEIEIGNGSDTEQEQNDTENDTSQPETSNIVVRDVSAEPQRLDVGQSLKISLEAVNEGEEQGSQIIGIETSEHSLNASIELEAGETTMVERELTFEEPGSYTVTVADRTISVQVDSQESNSAPSALIIIPLLLLAVAAFIYRYKASETSDSEEEDKFVFSYIDYGEEE